MSAIIVENLSKRYRIGHQVRHDTLRDALAHGMRKLLPGSRKTARPDQEDFWALRDVSFKVEPGEVVGIIGRNGAGKSTLLKILSRITEPTTGRITLNGRVASLLEVGTGFHPELSGRENIFLNGAILGMDRMEIRKKFDEIVAFSEVERFLDTPVKRYSSGMYVRLAFAVAAHLEPEILIVDEVLAVGDVSFRKKCMGRMRQVTEQSGSTILFVSHDLSAITALTRQSLLLEQGRTAFFGPTQEATWHYLSSRGALRTAAFDAPSPHPERPCVSAVQVRTSHPDGVQAAGEAMEVELHLHHATPVTGACLSFQIVNQFDQSATHLWLYHTDRPYARQRGRTILRCRIPKVRLNVGAYTLKVYFSEAPGGRTFDVLEGICAFEVVRLGTTTLWGWRPEACVYHEDANWTVDES